MQGLQNKQLTGLAKQLRKNMTKEEKHLWYDFLRTYPVSFYRQRVIGAYIVDFYCSKASLAVELDGNQHYETDEAEIKDQLRTDYLVNHGITVLSFSNRELNCNYRGVCDTIDLYVRKSLPFVRGETEG